MFIMSDSLKDLIIEDTFMLIYGKDNPEVFLRI
jgi:hypothetical protein